MDSILISVKKLLGIDEYCDHFDADIIMHINSVFVILNQLGVGTPGFMVTSNEERWTDFLGGSTQIEFVKTYVFMKVKSIFDPPQSSAAMESMNRVISEFEWRINVAVDPAPEKVPETPGIDEPTDPIEPSEPTEPDVGLGEEEI